MGMVFENLTEEELCDLMCGDPEEEPEESDWEDDKINEAYETNVLNIDEHNNPDLYQEMLNTIRKYRAKRISWGDIYYRLCMMLEGAMYDVEGDN